MSKCWAHSADLARPTHLGIPPSGGTAASALHVAHGLLPLDMSKAEPVTVPSDLLLPTTLVSVLTPQHPLPQIRNKRTSLTLPSPDTPRTIESCPFEPLQTSGTPLSPTTRPVSGPGHLARTSPCPPASSLGPFSQG